MFGDFNEKLAEALKPDPPKNLWFLVNFRVEATGEFACAVLTCATNSVAAVMDIYKLLKATDEGIAYSGSIEVPANKLPDESYRNRKLSREEVELLWR